MSVRVFSITERKKNREIVIKLPYYRYIRVVGTHNTANNVFHLVTVEAYFREEIPDVDKNGIIRPKKNVACVKEGTKKTFDKIMAFLFARII